MESLSSKQAQKVAWVLSLIEELPTIPTKYFKKLVNTDENHAFQKRTQKTPRNAIQVAEKRKQEYFNRRKVK